MHILIADDEAVSRTLLVRTLELWGHEVNHVVDGLEACTRLIMPGAPTLAILDWSMPGADGVALCREIRESPALSAMYVILLTAHDTRDAMVAGLSGGADEYVTKPFDWGVLQARIKIGARITTLQQTLSQRVDELQKALTMVKQLSGLLPICSYCKRIRRDGDYWQQLEAYVAEHSEAEFSHGVCPECFEQAKKEFGF